VAGSPCAVAAGWSIGARSPGTRPSVVGRARAGERLIITVDGIPAAEIGPVSTAERASSLDELIATGAVVPARFRTASGAARPVPAPSGRSSSSVLRQLRDR
jgi:antitoxin (DNA-binding transcriptional repressor) of toxin-antitoxin stability system